MLLKSLTTRAGQTVELGSLTVLVGPNNSGKSECLRDVYRLLLNREPPRDARDSEKVAPTAVLGEVRLLSARTPEQMMAGLQSPLPTAEAGQVAQGIHADLAAPYSIAIRKDAWRLLSRPDLASEALRQSELIHLMPLKVAYCPLLARLRIGSSCPASSPTAAPANFLQLLQLAGPDVHQALSAACLEVFGRDVRLDASQRVQLTLRTGDTFPTEPSDLLEAVRFFARFPRLEDEGDGFRSFVGTVLCLLLLPGRLILLEHPEAFLHPTQCEKLGRWLAAHAERRSNQVLLSTHSVSLLTGLSVRGSDAAIVRLSRQGSETRVGVLPQPVLHALGHSPQLAGQKALECVFREGVVITTDDSDRAIYEGVANQTLRDSRTSFLQCRGRTYVAGLVKLLRSAGIPTCAAVDLRIFDSPNAFAELVEVVTGATPPRGWLRIRQKLADVVEMLTDTDALAESTAAMEDFLDKVKLGIAEPTRKLHRTSTLTTAEHWAKFNQQGSSELPRDLRLWVQELIEELKRCGVFVSPKGNSENWFDLEEVREHSDDWFATALTQLMQGQCPMELKIYVSEMLQYIYASATPARPARLSNQASTTAPGIAAS